MAWIDGKYEVLEERSQGGGQTIYSVRAEALPGAEAGELLRLAWFDVTTPEERNAFHRYRAALKALAPAGLADVVARPGAYYAVWREVSGLALATFQAQPVKTEAALGHLRELAATLAAQGFALMDAEIVVDGDEPRVAYLAPATRTPQEAESLSAAALTPLSQGRVRKTRAPRSVWTWLPGIASLIGAAYFGVQAAQIYLNPALADVPTVTGQEAKAAADKLTALGYRVQYAQGDERSAALGAVINQEPPAGSTLHLGRLITLTVNNPPTLTVPRLEDLTVDQVKASLAENALKLQSVATVDGAISNTPKGRVVAQLPVPGSIIRRGQGVKLLVSGGISAPQTWLPPLDGLTFDQARELVRRAGLVVATVRKEASEAAVNTVLRQSPAAYREVDTGSPVTLVVADARYQPPAISVPPLPVPAPIKPPAPEVDPNTVPAGPEFAPTAPETAPQTPTTDTPTPDNTVPDPTADPTPAAPPDSTGTSIQVTPVAPTPTTPPATPAAPGSRSVPMTYAFPADLPGNSTEILVRDEDGERVVLPATPSAQLAGNIARRDDVQVRGVYSFVVRIDGNDYATFGP
ncbi:PASTA domain-containing protein [Deinococcus sp.]|uniref:PASTA domain-containing protein n=1 Tax=Deinococcus sp. TaxID=47478 RepID=UPI003B5B491A